MQESAERMRTVDPFVRTGRVPRACAAKSVYTRRTALLRAEGAKDGIDHKAAAHRMLQAAANG